MVNTILIRFVMTHVMNMRWVFFTLMLYWHKALRSGGSIHVPCSTVSQIQNKFNHLLPVTVVGLNGTEGRFRMEQLSVSSWDQCREKSQDNGSRNRQITLQRNLDFDRTGKCLSTEIVIHLFWKRAIGLFY